MKSSCRGRRYQTPLPPGEGDEEFEEILRELDENGYDGPLTLELHGRFVGPDTYETASETMAEAGYPIQD